MFIMTWMKPRAVEFVKSGESGHAPRPYIVFPDGSMLWNLPMGFTDKTAGIQR